MPAQNVTPPRPHGTGLRGANLSRSSPLFSGPFGRLFRALPPADFGDDEPSLYEDGRSFVLGRQLAGAAANPKARDLPRSQVNDPQTNPRRAIIGDPRNDENVIVSQLQGLFHRFHNKLAADHPDWTFP